jgi:hypothetical protein
VGKKRHVLPDLIFPCTIFFHSIDTLNARQ